MPYLRANAGMACTLPFGIGKAKAERLAMSKKEEIKNPPRVMDASCKTRRLNNACNTDNIAPPAKCRTAMPQDTERPQNAGPRESPRSLADDETCASSLGVSKRKPLCCLAKRG